MPTKKKYLSKNSDENPHWFELSKNGPNLHFYHANAYPFGTYRQMLNKLAPKFNVFGLGLRATWENIGRPSNQIKWMTYADDLISFLEATNRSPVIGVGHSIGAVSTMLAASKRPDLFSKLILIDPVFLPTRFWMLYQSAPVKLKHRYPFISKTLSRPDKWSSPEECIDFHRHKKAFFRFPEKVLTDFGTYALKRDKEENFQLIFPKDWEAHIYCTVPYVWRRLKSIQVPILAIRGELSDTLSIAAWNKWKKLRPADTFVELPNAGHLVPHEAPKETARTIITHICG